MPEPRHFRKIVSLKQLTCELASVRKLGKKIVFTNGCFDILHTGHIRYLLKAKNLGDILIVGLNSDSSIRKIKDNKRPVVPENERAEILAALEMIDYVVIFNHSTPLMLIQEIRPDILVKGADWKEGDIIGSEIVKKGGGHVVRVDMVEGRSTTKIIEKIVALYCNR